MTAVWAPPALTLAAIDLGSNSFHMVVARLEDGQLRIVDRLREMVQLAAGLDDEQNLSADAQRRALDCLARFGQRLRALEPGRLRVVGTNTLRQASNGPAFLEQAESLLGHPIDVISGMEEARLIHLGVAHHSPGDPMTSRLVIDIGGGSTELIIGRGFAPQCMESLAMGCVQMTHSCFADGLFDAARLRQAEVLCALELEPVASNFLRRGWDAVTGCSGSVRAVQEVAVRQGWCEEDLTYDAMRRLRELLPSLRSTVALDRLGVGRERQRIFVGGFVVLWSLFEGLGIERMRVSDAALREGVLYDLLGRLRHEDVRDRTIRQQMRRFGVDVAQSERVASEAERLRQQVEANWELQDEQWVQALDWAARLHEIGLSVAHASYHRHGAYILSHADLPGFSQVEQRLVALLVQAHRRKLAAVPFHELPSRMIGRARHLAVLLRLAVLLHRGRGHHAAPGQVGLQVSGSDLTLLLPAGWLADHPLTVVDLESEVRYLKAVGYRLRISEPA